MTDKRSKPTKPRTKRAINGIKETYHRKTSRQATKQPEAHANAQNRKTNIHGRKTYKRQEHLRKSTGAAQSAPNEKEEEKI